MMHMVKILNRDFIGTECGLDTPQLLKAHITNAESQVTCEACIHNVSQRVAERNQ